MLSIDEFSSASSWDGTLSSEEQASFSTFGFNVPLIESSAYFEQIYISSPIQRKTFLNSRVLTSVSIDSLVTTEISFDSLLGD